MAVTSNSSAPYAPAKAILDIIARYRSRGLPSPITAEVLGRAGISDSLIPRTLQSLQVLDLIDDKGVPSPTLDGLRLAPESEYPERLADWVRQAYSDVLSFVDPATATDTQIRDAFRPYNPVGQQPRMVSLFSGLCIAAGIGPEKSSSSRQPRQPRANGGAPGASPGAKRSPAPKGKGDPDLPPKTPAPSHGQHAFERELLMKFPVFDPAWSDALKAEWFKGFQQFMAMTKPDAGKG